MKFIRKVTKKEEQKTNSKDAAKERLHLVLMQDRANVSADFLELMKQEIIEVIKKYIEVDENSIDVRLTNKDNGDGTKGAPALYANIPIVNIKEEIKTERKSNSEEKDEKNPKDNTNKDKKEAKPKEKDGNKDKKIKDSKNEDKVLTIDNDETEDTKKSKKIIHEEQEEKKEKVSVKNTKN